VPELPEVETVVRDLRPLLVNRRFSAIQVGERSLRRKWSPDWNAVVTGRTVQAVDRRGKWIVVVLDTGACLLFHLGMTGQMRVVPSKEAVENHTHLVLSLDRGQSQLRFRDVRRFGSATLFGSHQDLDLFFERSKLGPEPFGLSLPYFRERVTKSGRCLKAILLDQQVVAGVGNIYADESLFAARLPPTQLGRDTMAAQTKRLRDSIEVVLTRAIDRRGSTIRDYIGGSGLKGGFQEEFTVYGRTGEPCLRCSSKIERIRLAGRSTHYCPKCQKSEVRSQKSEVRSQKLPTDH
jgi:formamidopyrimidine-DNA glycosylase